MYVFIPNFRTFHKLMLQIITAVPVVTLITFLYFVTFTYVLCPNEVVTSEIKLKQNCFVSVLFQFYFICNHCLKCHTLSIDLSIALIAVKRRYNMMLSLRRTEICGRHRNLHDTVKYSAILSR